MLSGVSHFVVHPQYDVGHYERKCKLCPDMHERDSPHCATCEEEIVDYEDSGDDEIDSNNDQKMESQGTKREATTEFIMTDMSSTLNYDQQDDNVKKYDVKKRSCTTSSSTSSLQANIATVKHNVKKRSCPSLSKTTEPIKKKIVKKNKIINLVHEESSNFKYTVVDFVKHEHFTSITQAQKREIIDRLNCQITTKLGEECEVKIVLKDNKK